MRWLLISVTTLILALAGLATATAQDAPGPVRVIPVTDTIDPVVAQFVSDRIDRAESDGASAVILRIDTPGGAVSAARDIIAAMETATVPVAVWVGPSGARAASAGAYISAAADALAMAPGTNIGSATPVGSGGEDLDAKVRNDLAASIASLAEQHGRNADVYRAMVTEALNLTAQEAVAQGAAESIQSSIPDMVAWLDGRPADGGAFATAGAAIDEESMPWYLEALRVVIDPNLIFLLLLLGIAGLGFEIFNPGTFVPGVVGAISLVIAMAGLSVMPFSWLGIVLIVLGVALFAAEMQVGGIGVLTIGGTVCLALGGVLLFDTGDSSLTTSPWVAAVMAVLFAGAFVASARLVLIARRRPVVTGDGTLVGEHGVVRDAVGAAGGTVTVNGELWSARAAGDTEIATGTPVRVVRVHTEDLTLTVEPGEG